MTSFLFPETLLETDDTTTFTRRNMTRPVETHPLNKLGIHLGRMGCLGFECTTYG